MTAIFTDAQPGNDVLRTRLYDGDLFVYSPSAASAALCGFAREMVCDAFGPLDPELAQFELPVERYASLLAELKPRFIHHAETKRLLRDLLRSLGFDETRTYFDVPRLRSSTSDGYLTTGIAYAFHPHRDTWYSAPMCQINLWMPVFAVRPDNIMAFHPQYWSRPVLNSSAGYDYQRWNATSRFNAAQHVGKDTREQPKALEPLELEPDLRIVTPVAGVQLFSAAQLHSSIGNESGRTRFSIDFRILNVDDARAGIGAPNVDSHCTGTALGDFLRLSDLAPIDQELVQRYLPGHPQRPRHSPQRAGVRAQDA